MVRSAYGIGNLDDCWNDCLVSCFCPCCTINQMIQTTNEKKNPSTNGGKPFNTRAFSAQGSSNQFYQCLCALCCMPCSVGEFLQKGVGMPYLLGCFCAPLFYARNIIRYQYRIRPESSSDCMTECVVPYAYYCCMNCLLSIIAGFIPCVYCCVCPVIWGPLVAMIMQIMTGNICPSTIQCHGLIFS